MNCLPVALKLFRERIDNLNTIKNKELAHSAQAPDFLLS